MEVFAGHLQPIHHPSGFPPRIRGTGPLSIAGMTIWGAILREPFHPGSRPVFPTNRSCRLAPAHQGWKMGVWLLELFACHICHPLPPLWIPAFAGMTIWGAILREPLIFLPIAHAGWCRRTEA